MPKPSGLFARLVGLFGLVLAMSGTLWWSGAAWAQASPTRQCRTPDPQCRASAASSCQAEVKSSSNSAYTSCLNDRIHQCQWVWVACP
jgi:hypothetical protein